MNISTKNGDNGETSLVNGDKVYKNDIRIKSCGDIDELNSFLGISLTMIKKESSRKLIINIQHKLFVVGSQLSSPLEDINSKIPTIKTKDLNLIEDSIEKLEKNLPKLSHFILPGGSTSSAIISYARSICRRAERKIVEYIKEYKIGEIKKTERQENILLILKYINRLSDLLFLISRDENISNNFKEVYWDKNI